MPAAMSAAVGKVCGVSGAALNGYPALSYSERIMARPPRPAAPRTSLGTGGSVSDRLARRMKNPTRGPARETGFAGNRREPRSAAEVAEANALASCG